MQILALFFEISDKVIQVQMMYVLFIILGIIGLSLGFWRWWLSAIWLIFPIVFALILFIQTNYSYEARILQFGEGYIWHSYFSVIIGIGLNLIGIFKKFFKRKKLILQ
jgi:hypothetical protein